MKYILLFLTIVTNVTAQLFLKKGASILSEYTDSVRFTDKILYALQNRSIWLGLGFFSISFVLYIVVLMKFELSFAYPFLALSYVLILLSSKIFLGESISMLRWSGVFVICIGVILVSRS